MCCAVQWEFLIEEWVRILRVREKDFVGLFLNFLFTSFESIQMQNSSKRENAPQNLRSRTFFFFLWRLLRLDNLAWHYMTMLFKIAAWIDFPARNLEVLLIFYEGSINNWYLPIFFFLGTNWKMMYVNLCMMHVMNGWKQCGKGSNPFLEVLNQTLEIWWVT